MKKILPFFFVAFAFLSCDYYRETVYNDIESASYSYRNLKDSISLATANIMMLCDEIEDEDLYDEIIEQLGKIYSYIEKDGCDISYHLEDAMDAIEQYEMEMERDD